MENDCVKKEVYCDVCESYATKRYISINYDKWGMFDDMNEPACCIEWKRATYCPNCGRKLADNGEEE